MLSGVWTAIRESFTERVAPLILRSQTQAARQYTLDIVDGLLNTAGESKIQEALLAECDRLKGLFSEKAKALVREEMPDRLARMFERHHLALVKRRGDYWCESAYMEDLEATAGWIIQECLSQGLASVLQEMLSELLRWCITNFHCDKGSDSNSRVSLNEKALSRHIGLYLAGGATTGGMVAGATAAGAATAAAGGSTLMLAVAATGIGLAAAVIVGGVSTCMVTNWSYQEAQATVARRVVERLLQPNVWQVVEDGAFEPLVQGVRAFRQERIQRLLTEKDTRPLCLELPQFRRVQAYAAQLERLLVLSNPSLQADPSRCTTAVHVSTDASSALGYRVRCKTRRASVSSGNVTLAEASLSRKLVLN